MLAAILFPVFARARENARRTSCASNLKQIGLAAAQYQQDYDDIYCPAYHNYIDGYQNPPTPTMAYNRTTVPTSFDLLLPYAKNVQVFHCPSIKPRPKQADPVWVSNNHAVNRRKLNYGLNVGTAGNQACDGPGRPYFDSGGSSHYVNCKPVRDSEMSEPARTLYAADTWGNVQRTQTEGGAYFWRSSADPDPEGNSIHIADYRHQETGNFLFCDGHVKALSKGAALRQKWTIK